MIALALFFSIVVVVLSFLIAKKSRSLETGELSTYIVCIAWGSLIVGVAISRFAG